MSKGITLVHYGEQKLSEEDKALVEEVYARVEAFEEQNRPYHEAARTAREILRLRDPYQDKPNAKEKTLQLQTLKSTFNNCVADQMLSLPEARLLPERPEDEEQAADLQDVVHYVTYVVNRYAELHRRRSEDMYGAGTAVTQVVWDPDMHDGDGDIALIRCPIEGLLWDPMAEDLQEARAIIKVSWHPMSWYQAHYPDEAPYVHEEDGQHNETGMPKTQKDKAATDEGRAMLLEYWYRTYDARTHKYAINLAYVAGGALLLHRKNVYEHGMYPFVVDVHSIVEGSLAGEGLVTELAPMMRYINRYARYIDTNLRMSSKGRILTRRNSGIDQDALSDWSRDIVEGDSITQGEDWAWMAHAPLNGMVVNQMLQMQSDLKMDSGANQYSRGESTAGVTSGKMLAALQTAGGKITGLRTETLNHGFRQMVEQILWLIGQMYTDDRTLLVTGKDGLKRNVQVKVPTPPRYMVQIEVNKLSPVRVEAQNEMFMEAFAMAAQSQQYFPLSALFRLLNIDGKDRLLPIIDQNETFMQQMQELQTQNQQLQEALAASEQEKQNLSKAASEMAGSIAKLDALGMPTQNAVDENPVNEARDMVQGFKPEPYMA